MTDAPSPPADESSDGVPPNDPKHNLPPVTPPSARFLMQLFVVPMVIVVVIVLVCLMFNWLAHLGTRPEELVDDLTRLNPGSWQKALTIANLLCDRQQAELRQDPVLAGRLADILQQQLDEGNLEPESLKLRVYLCTALGVFEIEEGLPALIKAASTQRDPRETEVRKTALEAIARRAEGMPSGAEILRARTDVMATLMQAAQQQGGSPEETELNAQLRSRAAYTLGVLGGPEAMDQLAKMLSDPAASVRYNAANGLARYGDPRSLSCLADMLQPTRLQVPGEPPLDDVTLTTILQNALRSAANLARLNPSLNLESIEDGVNKLLADPQLTPAVRRGIEMDARTTLQALEARRSN